MTVTQGSSSLTTNYVYDGTMMIREMQVVTGSLISSATYFQGANGPAYRRNDLTGSIPHWYVYNGLGSVVGEVDPAGNYIASQEYDVYGNVRTNTQTGTFDTRQGYVGALGHQTDPETGGLIYMQARYYDPSTGRFCSQDPDKSGLNWFVYCGDNPANCVDPNGQQETAIFDWFMAAGLFFTVTAILMVVAVSFRALASGASTIALAGAGLVAGAASVFFGIAMLDCSKIPQVVMWGLGLANGMPAIVAGCVAVLKWAGSAMEMPDAQLATAMIIAVVADDFYLLGNEASIGVEA